MASKIQIRRDTVENWNLVANSVILAAGEIGYETNTRNLKIGDGTSVWSALKYQAPVYSGTNSTLAAATLAVDQTNNRVGIGTASPQAKLHTAVLGPTNGIVEIVQNTAGVTGSQIQITQSTIQDWAIGQPAATDAFAFWRGRNTGAAGSELMRISSAGRVGIGQSSPTQQLDVNGNITSNRTNANFVVTGDGAYAFGGDTKQYIYGTSGNGGQVSIYTSNAGGTSANTLVVTSGQVSANGIFSATGINAAASGLTSSGGFTLSSGALTLNAGTTTSFPAGSVAGAAIADNGVTVAKLAQVAVPSFLGTPSGTSSATNISALTQAQSRTMLGLIPNAYTSAILTSSAFVNTTVSGNADIFLSIDVTSLPVGVIQCLPITLARASNSGSASVVCSASMASGETLLVFGGFDNASVATFGSTTTGGASWYWRGEVWAATTGNPTDSQHVRFVPMYYITGTVDTNLFKWQGGAGNAGVVQVNAALVVMRLS